MQNGRIMKIKAKLNVGVGLLFLMIFLLAALGGWYINVLKKDTGNILTANYNTLLYAKNMLRALEELPQDPSALGRLSINLDKQRENVTEQGEQRTTDAIVSHYEALQKEPGNVAIISAIRMDLTQLMEQNMHAISLKSEVADRTAGQAVIVISIAGTLCFVIAFTLLINLPSSIADPIRKLTESIRQIAGQNYRERVHFAGTSEFAELAQSFNTMAEKLEEYSESKLDKILKAKQRIEALIDNMHDPVIGVDENRQIIFVNEEMLKVTALDKKNLLDLPIDQVVQQNDLLRDIFKNTLTASSEREDKLPIKIFADGRESYFEKDVIPINVTPTGELHEQFIGEVVILKNITPFKELDLAKTNFIGTISHEFKTPIASIQMGVQLLENERVGLLNPEQRNLLGGVKEDLERLLNITGELLNMTQVESGSIQISLHAAEVEPMIAYAVKANRSAAEQKGIGFKVDVDPQAHTVFADNEKTAWVLTNFLSNAVRYSHEDSLVHIQVEAADQRVRFSVKDSGQGVEPKYLDRIFERYFRVPGAKKGGTGLGLSISKEFIEAQGGEIGVTSEYGAGSLFYFYLRKGD